MEDLYKVGGRWLKTAASTTSTIASTTSSLVATSGARALGIIGSTSGRPEVPARAAAAAAVARKIAALPPHERHSFSFTENGSSFVCDIRSTGRTPEELEVFFFEEDFDPVRHMLSNLPQESVDINEQYFDNKVGGRLLQLDMITERLSRQVMENHEEMVNGMQLITELDRDLQLASVICKNGRRFVSMAAEEVKHDLLVAANVRRKEVLLDLLPVLDRVQLAIETKSRLDGIVQEGNYALALEIFLESMMLLHDCSELDAVMELNHSLEDWLQRTIDKIHTELLSVCHEFNAEKYTIVLHAYVVLDDVPSLAEKAQTFYSQIVVSETHSIIKNLLAKAKDSQVILQMSRVPYNELCSQLSEAKFRECLYRSLEVLFDVLCSYYEMMTWRPLLVVEDGSTENELDGSAVTSRNHQRSGSQGDLLPGGQQSWHARTGSLHGLSNHNLQGALTASYHSLWKSGFGRSKLSESDVFIGNGPASVEPISLGVEDQSKPSVSVEAGVLGVAKALERGRRALWELCARRIAVLLSCDALFTSPQHQFLQSLDQVNKFILAGEAFSGARALTLRAKLLKQSEKYFWTFHRQNLEVLRMILEKEFWQQLSSPSLDALSLSALVHRLPSSRTSHGGGQSESRRSGQEALENGLLTAKENTSTEASFDEWLRKGNPFTDRRMHTGEEKGSEMADDEGGGEDEDLLADFIDEDSQLPGRLLSDCKGNPERNNSLQLNGLEESLILTSSAVSLLRCMDKYVKLMQILQPIVSEVFRGLCQLFDLYFFSIFKVFGQRDFLAASLKSTLVRISQDLEEQRIQLPPSSSSLTGRPPVSPSPTGSSHLGLSEPSHTCTASLLSIVPSNLYALKERAVAVESLVCLLQILQHSYLDLKTTLPQDTLAYMEQFFAQFSVELLPELKLHVFRVAARLMLNVGGYIERIANTRWELKELGVEHNGYIDLLLGEFKQYTKKLLHGGVSKKIYDAMLEHGVAVLAETILEGVSRVKRCNNEGRALMTLDLQVLINGLHHLASPNAKSNLLVVETYIKAFYLPETEYLHWIRAHPEYTKSQVTGLINLVASTYNWKRKSKVELLDKIEIGDL